MKSNRILVAVFSMTLLSGTVVFPSMSIGSDRPVIPHAKQSLAHPEMLLQEPDSIPPRHGIARAEADPGELPAPLVQRYIEGARSAAKSHLAKVGGDDILITDSTPVVIAKGTIAIAGNGDIYVALAQFMESSGEEWISVYRSKNSGDTFELWGDIGGPGLSEFRRVESISIAEGDANRCFVQYSQFGDGPSRQYVAYSDLSVASASWTTRTIFTDPAISFMDGDMINDAESFSEFFLYAVCSGIDADGDDIWFTRSTDLGNSWSAPYRIGNQTGGFNHRYALPRIDWGFGGVLHVGWEVTERNQDLEDDGVYYRRALNWGEIPGDWDFIWVLGRIDDDIDQPFYDISASKTTNRVALMYSEFTAGGPHILTTDTGGADWSGAGQYPMPFDSGGSLAYRSSDATFVAIGREIEEDGTSLVLSQAAEASLDTWSTPTRFSDIPIGYEPGMFLALDPTHGNRAAVTFRPDGLGDEIMYFDAEWRNDPGYPNLEPGFPVDLPAEPNSPPAIVDIDGDPYGEIVFGDVDGNVWVYSHEGTVPGGWPQNVGGLPVNGPIAVGALDLSGDPYIVAGTTDGKVFAFTRNGTLVDGFPVNLGTDADTYVSIGALGGPYPRWIVACSGTRLVLISHRGTIDLIDWNLTGPLVGPAAIGDVDNDGVAEIITLMGPVPGSGFSYTHVVKKGNAAPVMSRPFPLHHFNDAPTLFDLDGDGDLEIAVPTREGQLFVMHHDGSDVAGFPFDNGTGTPLTSAAAANFIGTSEPDIAVASEDSRVHLLFHNGVQQSSYPEFTGTGWWLFGAPIIDQVNRSSANIIIGSRDAMAWSFQNTGGLPPGWPKSMGIPCELSPASGDFDLDGDNEIVFLTQTQMIMVDVNYPPESQPHLKWPMYGYDPQRTGCLDCEENLVSAAPIAGITRVSFAPPSPNPASGSLVFSYQIPSQASVKLEVFDIRGHRVRNVVRREELGGPYVVTFDGRSQKGQPLAAGQYFARLTVRGPGINEVQSRKFTLLR